MMFDLPSIDFRRFRVLIFAFQAVTYVPVISLNHTNLFVVGQVVDQVRSINCDHVAPLFGDSHMKLKKYFSHVS